MMIVRAAPLRSLSVLVLAGVFAACAATASDDAATGEGDSATAGVTAASEQDAFWSSLEGLCGNAYAGRLAQGGASDSTFRTAELVMHVRECSADTIRIPFHVGDDRSRTWVVTRTDHGLRLKHDHRHEDGTEDAITQYGGDSRGGTSEWQEFAADTHTAQLIPAASTNVWTIEVVPGERFAYALRREGTDRRFRVEFDLTQPVAAPPAPWGAE